jgi:hypothetical protein
MTDNYFYMAGFMLGLLFILRLISKREQTGGKTKCFSCEAQDGYLREYPSKCFSCERELFENNLTMQI